MKKLIMFSLFAALMTLMSKELTLKECYKLGKEAHPLNGEKAILYNSLERKLQNLKTAYYPVLNLTGQATYQSDVTKMDIDFPVIPGMDPISLPDPDKDQYKAALEIQQLIYDGGAVNLKKELEKKSNEIEVQNHEITLYQVQKQIDQAYFAILQAEKNLEVLKLHVNELKEKEMVLQAAITNGITTPEALQTLQAERLNLEQKIVELNNVSIAYRNVLSEIIGSKINKDVELNLPENMNLAKVARPEQNLFRLKQEALDINSKLIESKRKPFLSAFGQAGYGKPGLNMLQSDFHTYYLVGLSFKWNIYDYNQTKREKQVLNYAKQRVKLNNKLFDRQLAQSAKILEAEISKYKELLVKDEELISLNQKIKESAAAKLQNGVLTASDYLTKLNKVLTTQLNRENHKIGLMKSQISLETLNGKKF